MNSKLIVIFSLLIKILSGDRKQIYRCAHLNYRDEQCLTQEKLGDLQFVWLRKCKGSKVCVQLPYYGKMTGVCSVKVRSHYDGENCAKNNKCTSGICDGTKCKGFVKNHRCQPGLAQCAKGLVCRKESTSSKFHSCLKPIGPNESCDNYIDVQNTNYKYYEPDYNPCELGRVCSNGNCIIIGSVRTGETATNPLACESGIFNGTYCVEYKSKNDTCTLNSSNYYTCRGNNNTCMETSGGAYWCPTSAISDTFKEWFSVFRAKSKVEEDTVLGAYRYTANNKKANELFFRYTHYGLISDADECAYDYFWKNNSSNNLKVSIMILIFTILF